MKDIEIIEKCRAGEKEYFGKLYDRYIDKIYKYIYLKTSSKEVAEDITSDVFLSALDKIDSFHIDEQSNVNAWLYRIAHNKVINFYKSNKEYENI
jgi:RNA polymerase sigma-70 factor (ECF subfamily)